MTGKLRKKKRRYYRNVNGSELRKTFRKFGNAWLVKDPEQHLYDCYQSLLGNRSQEEKKEALHLMNLVNSPREMEAMIKLYLGQLLISDRLKDLERNNG